MVHAIWVKKYTGSHYVHIDDILRVFDHYGEAQVLYGTEDGRENQGYIDGPEIEKIRNYKPQIVELTLTGHARRVRREAGMKWSYYSFFDDELIPEPRYVATFQA